MNAAKIMLVAGMVLLAFSAGLFTAQNFEPSGLPRVGLVSLSAAERLESSIDIVAVLEEGEAGVINTATVEIVSGKGRVLFAFNPFVETDTQESAEIAAAVAQQFTGKSLADRDVIYAIENTDAKLIGGPSAGAALTVATIAAIEGKEIKENVVMTGTIESNGRIGEIGGVIEKAAAAAEQGKTLFLVPEGQSAITYYEQVLEEQRRGQFVFQRVRYIPKTLDLNEFSKEQEWNLEIKEISDIGEAVELMLE